MLCGPKSSGKSTFGRILGNRLLNDASASKGIAVLDLDPGQPEYSPPGQVSLIHILDPNFGPPFSHPVTIGQSKVVRSHAIGAITPSQDPGLYMACALDLYAHYKSLLQRYPKTPLIINTSGWVLGTGLEILAELIKKVRPTTVVYMSLDGPIEVVDSLKIASGAVPVVTLPSQSTEYATRTSAHLRTMQNMSYFHLEASNENDLRWKDTPLTSAPPWQVGYSDDEAGIMAVLCYGESPPPKLLHDAINGSVVSIVVIDDRLAIPSISNLNDYESTMTTTLDVTDNDLHILDDSTFHPSDLSQPLIVHTPEGIPYFNPTNSIALDPQYSHCIGLGLIRGIDVKRKCLQLLTPIPADIIHRAVEEGKKIILVSGKLDTPGWVYTESLTLNDILQKNTRRGGPQQRDNEDAEEEESDDIIEDDTSMMNLENKDKLGSEFEDVPWVSRITGSQGRGAGSRVWRVRRDLGRSEGGD